MRALIWRSLPVALLLSATACLPGCKRIMGYGDESAQVDVETGRPFELVYTPQSGEPHQLWLTYDVEYQGNDFRLQGPLEMQRGDEPVGAWTLALGKEGGPLEGASSRKSIGTVEVQINGQGSVSSTIHVVELPGSPAGQSVAIRGTWTAAPHTTANALRLVVTD